jgi:alpha-L-fucosidase
MIIRQEIKDFENLGFGMFVHFGAYSVLGKGEWARYKYQISKEDYQQYVDAFCPEKDWAEKLADAALGAGCKYITLTTRHHDGFSLYDTCGLNDYDTVHTCGRDLVREFVDACNARGLIPFFYHTLLDWYDPRYNTDFPAYLQFLRESVKLLCTNYGKIGGLWFDGKWNKPDADWEEDALYGTIRRYQPQCLIINNTGLDNRGAAGHIELDSVTFERGMPTPRDQSGAPKYLAGEMCEVFGEHWGYAEDDLNYNSPAYFIEELANCRKVGANMLMNVGPMANGYLRPIDAAMMEMLGTWVARFDEAIRSPRPCEVQLRESGSDSNFILQDAKNYYLFCFDLPIGGHKNVTLNLGSLKYHHVRFDLQDRIREAYWMDNGEAVAFEQNGFDTLVHTVPYDYGRNLVVRVAKIICE